MNLYTDIAHPINSAFREMLDQRVLQSFDEEKARSKLPGYKPSYDDFAQGDPRVVCCVPNGGDRAAEGKSGQKSSRLRQSILEPVAVDKPPPRLLFVGATARKRWIFATPIRA